MSCGVGVLLAGYNTGTFIVILLESGEVMRLLIYGAGALGQAIGCMLAADGHDVDLVLRERFKEAIVKNGLKVGGIFGDYEVAPGKIGAMTNLEGCRGEGYDYILLSTKTYDTESAVRDICALPGLTCPIVSMQNGCGNIERIASVYGESNTLGARVITGFEIDRPGLVKITVSADDVHIGGSVGGNIPEPALRLAAAINQSGLPCKAVEDIHRDLYAKLLYNCALNPLGAVLGVHYGALADNPESRKIIDRVIKETFSVIRAMGRSTHWESADAYKEVFYDRLVPMTYNHRPSMLQDIENGKPTEVDALVGYVAEQGERVGISTPTCSVLAGLVRFKEAGGGLMQR